MSFARLRLAARAAARRLRRLAGALPHYVRIAWWGIVSPRVQERTTLWVAQAVVRSESGVLLTVRRDLRGWELPGGNAHPREGLEEALVREVQEETGLAVAIERHVGDYHRSGFRPHVARVFACRVEGGQLATSAETPRVCWFAPEHVPDTLFPWYRVPLADALAERGQPVTRREHQGVRAILAGMAIDLRMRLTDDRAGSETLP